MPKSFNVDDDFNGSRLDKQFKNKVINLPHSLIEKIIRQNKLKLIKEKLNRHKFKWNLVDIRINKFKPTDKKK